MARGFKTGGRTKGTPNKLTQSVQEFIEAVLTQPEAEQYAKEFLELRGKNTGDAVRIFMRLLEYRFGTPKQNVQLTGPDGGPVEHTIKFDPGGKK